MNLRRKLLIVIGLSLLLCAVFAAQAKHLERAELFQHPGVQWLSWTPGERENFVYGYIHGYAQGMGEACLAADKLFEKDKPHVIGHDDVPSSFPSARCLRSVQQYPLIKSSPTTGPDFTPYTTVITEFYTKHPEYRDTPFTLLMEYLANPKNVTSDDLYFQLVGKSPAPSR
jgi:hypothetical protein